MSEVTGLYCSSAYYFENALVMIEKKLMAWRSSIVIFGLLASGLDSIVNYGARQLG